MRVGEHQEVELKLLVPPEDLARVRRHPRLRALAQGRPRTRALASVYFDTPDLDLARQGIALRLRRSGRSQVQTVKTEATGHAGLFQRGEWDSAVSGDLPDLDAVPDPALRARIARAIGGKTLAPVLRTEMRRSERLLREGDLEILCDLDVGEIRTPERSLPICELELELRRGDPAALYDLALELHETIALRPGLESKAERGFAALMGRGPLPQPARKPDLDPEISLDDAMAEIFASCAEQIQGNQEAARAGLEPEGVHQMRVGARRLRSALALFRGVLPGERVQSLRSELRWLGGELGEARDLDVFLDETLEPLLRHLPNDPALKRLRDAAREMRVEAYGRARQAIESRRYARFLLELGAWLAGRRWRQQSVSPESARLFAPARELAGPLLTRRLRSVRKLGSDLPRRTLDEKHALRIQVKKLRYAGEFFRSLYPRAGADRMLRRLARLQDVLGHLNDQGMADAILEDIVERLGPEVSADHLRGVGVVSGWTARNAQERLERLEGRWQRFAATAPFWNARG